MFVVIGSSFLGKLFTSNFEGCKNILKMKTFIKTNIPIKYF